jgi:hypothetical protein
LVIGLAFGYLPEKRGSFVAHPIAHGVIIPVFFAGGGRRFITAMAPRAARRRCCMV